MKAQELIATAYGGVVGIDESLNVFGGYDQQFQPAGATDERPEWIEPDDWYAMPKEEKFALADRMIGLWKRYKAAAV